ncbi:MAG: bifunctional enoyl-CoA hydratase/phosphate acetyltransferase [Candidatus Zixiibacteriota bacterium]|nr:MAG: bifunctional enoyl-CoA hydratase/phosphate acetyltransferase [candidate division Zixibacteria bacterium]
MKTLDDILTLAKKTGPKRVAVAQAEDEEVLLALEQARREGMVEAILIGRQERIEELASRNGIDPCKFKFHQEADGFSATLRCCQLVKSGKAHFLMKGLVGTAQFMRAILDKERGLATGRLLSHVAVFEIPTYSKLLMVTDAAINIAPTLMEKAQIIRNAVDVAHSLGTKLPNVACLAAVEKVYPDKMPATLDCASLSMMARRGQIKGAVVDGPFGLDNAVSEESARVKGVNSDMSGKVDVLLCPNVEAGNAIYKTLTAFANVRCGAIVVGTDAPVVLTSRADSQETKLASVALGVVNCQC